MTENNCKDVKYSPCGFVPKSISPMRPSEEAPRKVKYAWVVDVWASAVIHQGFGGLGDPDLSQINPKRPPEWKIYFSDPPYPDPKHPDPHAPDWSRANEIYQGTPGKYEAHPKSDVRVLFCSEVVESALKAFPAWFRAYLLHEYPRRGAYVPRMKGTVPYGPGEEMFIERVTLLRLVGFDQATVQELGQQAAGRVARMERRFRKAVTERYDARVPQKNAATKSVVSCVR